MTYIHARWMISTGHEFTHRDMLVVNGPYIQMRSIGHTFGHATMLVVNGSDTQMSGLGMTSINEAMDLDTDGWAYSLG